MCTEWITEEMQRHQDNARRHLIETATQETDTDAQTRFNLVGYQGEIRVDGSYVWVDCDGCTAFNEHLVGHYCFMKQKLKPDQQRYVDEWNRKSKSEAVLLLNKLLER